MTLDKDFRPGVAPKFFLTSDWAEVGQARKTGARRQSDGGPATHLPAG